jgi:succinate-semialdehyde dehydrogenase / glutarate-semialdehyde dehydrogenase
MDFGYMSMPEIRIDEALLADLAKVAFAAAAPDKIEVHTPYGGGVLGKIPAACEADVESAVNRARAAQAAWADRTIGERVGIFLRFHDLLLDRQKEVLDIIQCETGKARRHAVEEVLDTAIVSRYYALHAAALLGPRRRKGALPLLTQTWELRVPVGVAGFIVPWNYPLNLAITDAAAALIAGNTAVVRPDPQTSFTALWAVRLLREAGLPADVFPVITGDGPMLGAALSRRADYVMFTGSSRTGRMVGQEAAARLKGFSLELGGKNPLLVLADADVEAAVEGAVNGCFVGAGQVCVSIERIYVHESLFARFVERFAKRTGELKIGAALDYSIDVGSLVSERQLRTVEDHVRDALDKGATLVAGGHRRPDLGPYFYEPTILTDVRPDMKVFRDETFGPVVSVYPFSSEQEAVELANASSYGLSASIWSRNTANAVRLARKIQAGSVNINEAYSAAWASVDSPIGGMKESGMRPRHGAEGILKFTESQTIAVQRLLPIGPRRGVDPAAHARVMTWLLKLVKRTRVMG